MIEENKSCLLSPSEPNQDPSRFDSLDARQVFLETIMTVILDSDENVVKWSFKFLKHDFVNRTWFSSITGSGQLHTGPALWRHAFAIRIRKVHVVNCYPRPAATDHCP